MSLFCHRKKYFGVEGEKALIYSPADKEIPELDVLTSIGDRDFIGRTYGDKPQHFVKNRTWGPLMTW
jgi:hypothetical protein